MNIKPVSAVKTAQNTASVKSKVKKESQNKNVLPKIIFLTGAMSAAAIGGYLLAKKPPINIAEKIKKLTEKTQKPPKITFDKPLQKPDSPFDVETVTTILKNGVTKTDVIKTNPFIGGDITSTFNPPINGVSSMNIFKFSNGDTSHITTFDSLGNVIKEIQFRHNYSARKRVENIFIDTGKGKTTIDFNFFKQLPEKVKSVTISYPDGSQKVTKIPASIKTKLTNTLAMF